jgi:hypothetical protein
MALHGLREATRDVDTITVLDEAVSSAAHEVSRRRGLAPHWLNSHARPWPPLGCESRTATSCSRTRTSSSWARQQTRSFL